MLLGQWKRRSQQNQRKVGVEIHGGRQEKSKSLSKNTKCLQMRITKKSAVIFNDKVIVSVEIEILNNYDRNSIGDSESNPGCETVKVRGKIPQEPLGVGINSSHGKSNLMACALRLTLLWTGKGKHLKVPVMHIVDYNVISRVRDMNDVEQPSYLKGSKRNWHLSLQEKQFQLDQKVEMRNISKKDVYIGGILFCQIMSTIGQSRRFYGFSDEWEMRLD